MSWIDFIPVFLTAVAALIDLRRREIPDWIWIAILALTPIRVWWSWPDIVPWHLPLGAIAALGVGCLVAGDDRFGGGDVKLFASLGAWFGIIAVVPLLLWIAIAGLPLALMAAARGRKDYAYGPAILVGVSIHWWVPDLLGRIGGWN